MRAHWLCVLVCWGWCAGAGVLGLVCWGWWAGAGVLGLVCWGWCAGAGALAEGVRAHVEELANLDLLDLGAGALGDADGLALFESARDDAPNAQPADELRRWESSARRCEQGQAAGA